MKYSALQLFAIDIKHHVQVSVSNSSRSQQSHGTINKTFVTFMRAAPWATVDNPKQISLSNFALIVYF